MISDPAILKQYGLVPKALPKRHPTTHQVFGSIQPTELPPSIELPDIVGPVDQGMSSFCYAYCVRQLCSDQDNVVYDENWIIAMVGELLGAPAVNGAPALDAMQEAVVYGAIKSMDGPVGMTWQEKGPEFIADWKNWPSDLYLKSAQAEKPSVLTVNGPYDAFDNIRSWIATKRRHAALATQWFSEFNQPDGSGMVRAVANPQTDPFSWHMYEAMDYDVVNGVEVIRIKPHEGAGYGKGGYAYFDRPTVNSLLANPLAGSLAFGDVPTSILQRLLLQHRSLDEIFQEIAARVENAL